MASSTIVSQAYHILQQYWPYGLILAFLGWALRNRYGYGLSDVPGPFLASFTELWLFFHVWNEKGTTEYELHRKYNSPIIRLGPNILSFSNAEAVRTIYGYKPVFTKSDFYLSSAQVNAKGEIYDTLASTMDEDEHARQRRPVAHAYSMSSLVTYESRIDSTFRAFTAELESRFVDTGTQCPMHKWLQMYAFDVIGEIVFSRRLGFLESGEDVGNMMFYTGLMLRYVGLMGHLPWVDRVIRVYNPVVTARVNKPVLQFTVDMMREHEKASAQFSHPDLYTHFSRSAAKYPTIMDADRIADNARSAIGGGSDTTSIILREIVYQLLIDPARLARVKEEIKVALSTRDKNSPAYDEGIHWVEGMKMRYVQACIKEALRFHPPLGQLLLRNVPRGGTTICNRFIPQGIVVGCNAWTVHRDKSFYGEDADQYRPERWIDSSPEHIQKMENLTLAFGGGPRVCIGKNIALLEITKTVPELFRRFEIKLVDHKEFKFASGWLTPQRGLNVYLKRRDQSEWIGA